MASTFKILAPDPFILGDKHPDEQAAFIAEKQRMLYKGAMPAGGLSLDLQYACRVYEVVDDGWRWGVRTAEGRVVYAPAGSAEVPLPDVTTANIRKYAGIEALEALVAQLEARVAELEAERDPVARSVRQVERELAGG